MARLGPGDKAPEFSCPDEEGMRVSLADFGGRALLVYFFPKAGTSG